MHSFLDYVLELSLFEFIFLISIVFIGALIRGYAGFGFSAFFVATGSLFIPTADAVIMVLFMEMAASLQMIPQAYRHINKRMILYLLLMMAVFSPIGQFFLRWFSTDILRLIAGTLLLLSVFLNVGRWRMLALQNKPSTWLLCGGVAGFMNGLLAMGGLWMTTILINSGIKIVTLRATLIVMLFLTDFYALSVAHYNNMVEMKHMLRLPLLLPFMFCGVFIGSRLFNPDKEVQYRKVVLMILASIAILLIVKTTVQLFL